jgi:hypothetical protein
MVLALPGVPRYPPVSVGGAAVTLSVSSGLDVIPATTALRLVDPAATPVTRPAVLTVAMVVAELLQVETALPWESAVVQVVDEPSE